MAKKKGNRGKGAAKPSPSPALEAPTPPIQNQKPNDPQEYSIEEISAAVASVTTIPNSALSKLCRLCESKDGPFLNIFDADKVLAKKINRLLPVVIDEYDKLPHKICFRCSAKVEELHEFVEKCIRTQESLKRNVGESKAALARKKWEDKLKESKVSNDDYCESLIKQALQKIGVVTDFEPPDVETPTEPEPNESSYLSEPIILDVTPPPQKRGKGYKSSLNKNDSKDEEKEVTAKDARKSGEDDRRQYPVRSTRSKIDMRDSSPDEALSKYDTSKSRSSRTKGLPVPAYEEPASKAVTTAPKVETTQQNSALSNSLVGMLIKEKKIELKPRKRKLEPQLDEGDDDDIQEILMSEPKKTYEKQPRRSFNNQVEKTNGSAEKSIEKHIEIEEKVVEVSKEPQTEETGEYDIMQHVCTIKVGGAGLLYQCKLCKRNFLKKEVVLGHNCARARQEMAKVKQAKPDPVFIPKPDTPTLTITPKNPPKQSLSDKEIIEAFKLKTAQSLSINSFSMDTQPPPPPPPKPKPGPASRKKISSSDTGLSNLSSIHQQNIVPSKPPPLNTAPSVEIPSGFPTSKNRYKLVPGPNNTFTLVEEPSNKKVEEPPKPILENQIIARPVTVKRKTKQRVDVIDVEDDGPSVPPPQLTARNLQAHNQHYTNLSSTEFSQFPGSSLSQQQTLPNASLPYPVGLFQTVPHTPAPQPAPYSTSTSYATPAPNKQSYSIVQTGHPSKLLISTKATPPQPPPVIAKVKKGKKLITAEPPKQPFKVTLEDTAPQKGQNEGFFTFINVDPLLQPSYVLPTASIIQESQITTSTPVAAQPQTSKKVDNVEIYTCELCNMAFTREKKLLAHLQTHYARMDTEDEERNATVKKKYRK